MKKNIAFICVHNSCRSQIAEALGKLYLGKNFNCYSAGTEVKEKINQDAVRLMKKLYKIDMEKNGQYSKLMNQIPKADILISMGCEVSCPYTEKPFDDNWNLEDPTGKTDAVFENVIKQIEKKILEMKYSYQNKNSPNTGESKNGKSEIRTRDRVTPIRP